MSFNIKLALLSSINRIRKCFEPVYIKDLQGVVQQRQPGWAPNDLDDNCFVMWNGGTQCFSYSRVTHSSWSWICSVLNKRTSLTFCRGWDLWFKKRENQRCPLRLTKVNVVSSNWLTQAVHAKILNIITHIDHIDHTAVLPLVTHSCLMFCSSQIQFNFLWEVLWSYPPSVSQRENSPLEEFMLNWLQWVVLTLVMFKKNISYFL